MTTTIQNVRLQGKEIGELDNNNVEAGREFVKAYVEYTHYVKRIHDAAAHEAVGYFRETAATSPNANPY